MQTWLNDAYIHAEQEYPKESCGLVYMKSGKIFYGPCRNLASRDDHFILHHEDYIKYADDGTILEIVHSHPNYPPKPSQADLVECEKGIFPWTIIGWPSKKTQQIKPKGYEAPYEGRQFVFNILDCYTIIRDWYKREYNIELTDYYREDHFWERNEDLYEDNFATEGFIEVEFDDIQPGDLIFMALKSRVINHAAIFIGYQDFGGRTKVPVILHHVQGRLSQKIVYGGWWAQNMRKVIRHYTMFEVTHDQS